MKYILITVIAVNIIAVGLARPEPPKPRYGAPPPVPQKEYGPPPAPQKEYGPPRAPQKEYGPPRAPLKEYGSPPAPQQVYGQPSPQAEIYVNHEEAPQQSLPLYDPPAPFYGPPATFYGPPPTAAALVTKNVYVHVPPQEPEAYNLPEPIQTAVPKKHYKIIFIKAPNPAQPIRQVVPPTVQDEHKTLVYVLVKKPEEQEPLLLPSPAPTEPSKPEVYFIKYKQNKPADQYGPPPAPAQTYGIPSEAERF